MSTYMLLCLLVFAVAYVVNMTFITVFYHRGLTHGALTMSPFAQKLVQYMGNWVTGLDPKGWACMHRMHHMYSDTPADPHSPVQFGIFGVLWAQFKSYERALFRLQRGDKKYCDVVADIPYQTNWVNRKKVWFLPYVIHAVIAVVPGVIGGWWALGACYWAGMMSHPIQGWMVNSFGHAVGYRNFNTDDQSRNNTFVAWTVMGEGFQNNHHQYPASAKFSYRWFEIDPGYLLCLILDRCGLIEIQRGLLISRAGAESHTRVPIA